MFLNVFYKSEKKHVFYVFYLQSNVLTCMVLTAIKTDTQTHTTENSITLAARIGPSKNGRF